MEYCVFFYLFANVPKKILMLNAETIVWIWTALQFSKLSTMRQISPVRNAYET